MDQTGRSLISLEGLDREDILWLLGHAAQFEANPNRKTLDGKIVATLFFEPSTRTRLRCCDNKFVKGRDSQGHHHDGKQLCGPDHNAPLS